MKKKDDKQSMAIKKPAIKLKKKSVQLNWKYSSLRVSSKREKCPPRVETAAGQTANGNHGKGLFTWPKEDVFRTSAKSLFWKFTLCLIKVKLHREKSWNVHNQEECWDYFLEQTFKHLRRFFLTIFCELGRYTVLIVFKICNLVFFALDLIIYTRSILMLLNI